MARLKVFLVIALLIFLPSLSVAVAGDAKLFSGEAEAQKHCPTDVVVWVNIPSGIYHFKGMRWYATTNNGAFVCRKEGDQAGYRGTRNGQ